MTRRDAPEQDVPERPRIAGEGAVLLRDNVRERHFPVDGNFIGCRLDRFLTLRLARLSRTKANAIIRFGNLEILPHRRRPRPSMRLQAGETVILREQLDPEWVQDHQVELLHEDDALWIVNKPAGMLVHESASVRLNTVQSWMHRQGEFEAEPAHRLDRETSGVLVCARRPEFIHVLRDLFASEHPKKVYRALVLDPDGVWQEACPHTIREPLGPITGEVLTVRMGAGDLHAVTHVEKVGELEHPRFGRMSDLKVTIETGRQHQIRVHLDMMGTPIAGDKLYGQTDEFFMATCDRPNDAELLETLPFVRHALHAWRLTMPHPMDRGRVMQFEAPLPEDIWGRHDSGSSSGSASEGVSVTSNSG